VDIGGQTITLEERHIKEVKRELAGEGELVGDMHMGEDVKVLVRV